MEVVKNSVFIVCVILSIVMFAFGVIAISRYTYEVEENNNLKKQIEQQTTLIEYLKEIK